MRLRGLISAAALAAAVALPGVAAGRIIQSTSILPPGESGYVSITGVASGTGSPHLYDQQQPFIDFQRKNAMLGQAGTGESTPMGGVTITRDAYGVPRSPA